MSELFIAADTSYKDIPMEPHLDVSRPYTLTKGEHYIYTDRCCVEAKTVLRDVEFVAYTSCPAIVVVLDGSGQKVRVLRENLYSYKDSKNAISHRNQVGVTWNNT